MTDEQKKIRDEARAKKAAMIAERAKTGAQPVAKKTFREVMAKKAEKLVEDVWDD